VPDLFDYCISFVIGNEIYQGPHGIVSLYEDEKTGEVSNWGISLKFLQSVQPGVTADTIKALTEDEAKAIYQRYFWGPANIDLIELPTVASRVLDMQVNDGAPNGVRCLQRALGLTADGILGSHTAAACNASNEQALYSAFCREATTRYQAVHDAQVGEYGQSVADRNLQEWITRLQKLPPPYRAGS
jgi:lysozyme family protein